MNKLQNIANYLNRSWKPNWKDGPEEKYYIYVECNSNNIEVTWNIHFNSGSPVFKTKELAQEAIEILGKEEIIKYLSV